MQVILKNLTLDEKLLVLQKSKRLEVDNICEEVAFFAYKSIYEGKICAGSIVIEDFFYTTSKEIFDYLSENLSCECQI